MRLAKQLLERRRPSPPQATKVGIGAARPIDLDPRMIGRWHGWRAPIFRRAPKGYEPGSRQLELGPVTSHDLAGSVVIANEWVGSRITQAMV